MDAEKACDRVNWGFMNEVLKGIGLGGVDDEMGIGLVRRPKGQSQGEWYPLITLIYMTAPGVHFTSDIKLLYELNYGSFLVRIIKDLQRWRSHSLTWFGRVNALKMNIIPRIIYVLYTVPIPLIFFKWIRKAFISFVWNALE